MTATEAKWRQRVRAWKESGQSAAAFVVGQPYKASSLRFWSSRLRQLENAPNARVSAAPRVAMVQVIRASSHPPRAPLAIEIHGARIVVEKGFDGALLSEVVRALGGAR